MIWSTGGFSVTQNNLTFFSKRPVADEKLWVFLYHSYNREIYVKNFNKTLSIIIEANAVVKISENCDKI